MTVASKNRWVGYCSLFIQNRLPSSIGQPLLIVKPWTWWAIRCMSVVTTPQWPPVARNCCSWRWKICSFPALDVGRLQMGWFEIVHGGSPKTDSPSNTSIYGQSKGFFFGKKHWENKSLWKILLATCLTDGGLSGSWFGYGVTPWGHKDPPPGCAQENVFHARLNARPFGSLALGFSAWLVLVFSSISSCWCWPVLYLATLVCQRLKGMSRC